MANNMWLDKKVFMKQRSVDYKEKWKTLLYTNYVEKNLKPQSAPLLVMNIVRKYLILLIISSKSIYSSKTSTTLITMFSFYIIKEDSSSY